MHPLAHTFRGRGVTMADQTCRLLVGDVRERLAELAEAYDRTPRAWICDYHEGWIDSLEVAERWAE